MVNHWTRNPGFDGFDGQFPCTLKCPGHLNETYIQHIEYDLQLVLSQHNNLADLAQAVYGVESHAFDLVVEHVYKEIQRCVGKACRVTGQLAQGIHCSGTHLCGIYEEKQLI